MIKVAIFEDNKHLRETLEIVLNYSEGYVCVGTFPDCNHLTQQETKVLQLLVAGKSYKMIAADLIISFDTVKSHIRNMYAKLNVNSGTEAVSKALKDGLV